MSSSASSITVKRSRGRPRRVSSSLPANNTACVISPATLNVPIATSAISEPRVPVTIPAIGNFALIGETEEMSIIIESDDGTQKHITISHPPHSPPLHSSVDPSCFQFLNIASDYRFENCDQLPVSRLTRLKSEPASDYRFENCDQLPVSRLTRLKSEPASDYRFENCDQLPVSRLTRLKSEPADTNIVKVDSSNLSISTEASVAKASAKTKALKALKGNKLEHTKIGIMTSESELQSLYCIKCNYQAYFEQQFQQHMTEKHTDDSDLKRCICCPFFSFERAILDAHYTKHHPRNICDVCGFTAGHVYKVRRHMQRHDATGLECKICGKCYKDQYILKMHYKMVHTPISVVFRCDVCDKEFTRKAHLKRHIRTHEENKAFQCTYCDYRGCERSDVVKHMLIHDEPRHTCEVCGKTFRHVKNKQLHVKRHRGVRDFKCGLCSFFGYTFTDIRKHIERKHNVNFITSKAKRIVTCERCSCQFLDSHLKEHISSGECQELLSNAEKDRQRIDHDSLHVHDERGVNSDADISISLNQLFATTTSLPRDDIVNNQSFIAGCSDMTTTSDHVDEAIEFDSQLLVQSLWTGGSNKMIIMNSLLNDGDRVNLLTGQQFINGQSCAALDNACNGLATVGSHCIIDEGHS